LKKGFYFVEVKKILEKEILKICYLQPKKLVDTHIIEPLKKNCFIVFFTSRNNNKLKNTSFYPLIFSKICIDVNGISRGLRGLKPPKISEKLKILFKICSIY